VALSGVPAGADAIVTGASSGIGRAIALSLGRARMRVLLVGRNGGRLAEAARAIGGDAETLACDLTTTEGLDRLAARVPACLNVLIHAAGLYEFAPVSATEPSVMDRLLSVNFRVPHQVTRLCLPALRVAHGQIVFVNSSQGVSATRQAGGYAATKHALKALADSLRAELNADGIRVLSIFPGRTATPMQASIYAIEGREYTPERLMQPEDVATMVLAALSLGRSAEVTDIMMRPMRPG
jgi:short-subunit dehydrogenase